MTGLADQNGTGSTGIVPKQVSFAYNDAGQPLSIYCHAASDPVDALVTHYATASGGSGYDGDGRLVAMQVSINTLFFPTPANYSWQYDAAGNITQEISPDGTDNYSLDSADQLTTVKNGSNQVTENYVFDTNGNRTTTTLTTTAICMTGADNRLLCDGTYTYQFDKNGNRIQRTMISNGSLTLYAYDFRNRLIDVLFKTSAGVKTGEVQYTYDYAGRLICTATDATGSGVFTYVYSVYLGNNELLAFSDSTSLSGSGTRRALRRDLYGLGANQIIATDNYQNTVLWAAVNQVGSVCYVVKNDGTIVGHRTYDSFGNVQEYNASGVNVTDHGHASPAVSPSPSRARLTRSLRGSTSVSQSLVRLPHRPVHDARTPLGRARISMSTAATVPVENVDPSGMC